MRCCAARQPCTDLYTLVPACGNLEACSVQYRRGAVAEGYHTQIAAFDIAYAYLNLWNYGNEGAVITAIKQLISKKGGEIEESRRQES